MNKQFLLSRALKRAFSLIELLAVIALFSIMAVAVAPAVGSIAGASGTTQAVNDISGMVDHARLTAMRMSTWVWVGLADTTALEGGEQRLTAVEVISRDGSDSLAPDNLMQIVRPLHLKRVSTSTHEDPQVTVLGHEPSSFQFDWAVPTASGKKSVEFSKFVVGFSPRGEAVIAESSLKNWIKINLVSANNPNNIASVLISGPSGQVVVAK